MTTEHSASTPTLTTERLILRPLSLADAHDAFTKWTSDPDVARYMSWNTHESIDETYAWLEAEEAVRDVAGYYNFGLVDKACGELIGSAGITYFPESDHFILGYNLMKSYWGQGLATEAARCIVEFASDEAGIDTLFAYHALDNPASGRVLEKVGFVYTNDGIFVSDDGSKRYPRKEYRRDR